MKVFFTYFLLLSTLFSCTETNKVSQVIDGSLVSLDNYTIHRGVKGYEIATIVGVDGVVALSTDTSNLFCITKAGAIALKPEVELTDSSPMVYEIELDYGTGKKAFVLVNSDFITNKVVAHRGAWKNTGASQNSIGALTAAMHMGCQAIEFDVWFSADNVIVLSHDPTIGGKEVENTTAEELKKVQLNKGEFVPTLKDYLDIIKTQNRTKLVLEIKNSQKGDERNLELAEAAVRMIHDERAQAWVEYISFNFDHLLKIRELDKTTHIAYLETNKALEELKDATISGIDYHYSWFEKDKTLVTQSVALGLTTNFWTVNKEELMKSLLDANVNFITTDEPELLLKLVETDSK